MGDVWDSLGATTQDALLLALLLLPGVIIAWVVLRNLAPGALVRAMLRRYLWTNLVFVALIAVSIGLGTGIIAQERGLRDGTARAASKFDLVVTAPGSEVTMLLATVYLQPTNAPLLSGAVYQKIATHPRVSIAAPIAFGDSHAGAAMVGTIAPFVTHLAGDLAAGEMFATRFEAVIGARVPLEIGETFVPDHGRGDFVEADVHTDAFTVTGRMGRTGTPWDRAILVPVEGVWTVHGLSDGHGPGTAQRIGPPYDPEYFPGTPAILVRADQIWAHYALQSEFSTAETMAFFPGNVLLTLYGLLGDVRQVMTVLSTVTQILVAAGILAGLAILSRLFARRMALLRAIGAPDRFVFAVVWSYAAVLIVTGTVLGLGLGLGAAAVLSRIVSARTDIVIDAGLGWPELHLAAGFVAVTLILALVPAALSVRRSIVGDLRA